MTPEKTVFKLRDREGREFPILFWKNYGPVAPRLWTTNGSIGYVAKWTTEYITSGKYVVVDSVLGDLDFTDVEALRKALAESYTAWMESFTTRRTFS